MNGRLFFLATLVLVVGTLGVRYFSRDVVRSPAVQKTAELSVGSSTVHAIIAESSEERKRGLSGRPTLGEDEGMFFSFSSVGLYSFWMKDMLIPIDIIWIASDHTVADVTPHIRPESYPDVFYPKVPVQYVLEVPAGWATAHGVKIGDRVKLK